MTGVLLEARGLSKHFGAVKAVNDVSWTLGAGEIGGVVGPNGSGKTTFFNTLSGYFPASAGQVLWRGGDITKVPMRKRAKVGLVRTFQQAEVFSTLTVSENIGIAMDRAARNPRVTQMPDADALLEITGLTSFGHDMSGELSYGNKRLLGIAMALGTGPDALLLDEPTSGLNEAESLIVQDRLRALQKTGIAIGIIDHHMEFLLPLCDSILVLRSGTKLWEGLPEAFSTAEEVIEAYLGRQAPVDVLPAS